tara:strand:- start:672 stop:872 length:201 start_codon:yes stop_codon:yes gene_type:complete
MRTRFLLDVFIDIVKSDTCRQGALQGDIGVCNLTLDSQEFKYCLDQAVDALHTKTAVLIGIWTQVV